jgi:hypothetical protein
MEGGRRFVDGAKVATANYVIAFQTAHPTITTRAALATSSPTGRAEPLRE